MFRFWPPRHMRFRRRLPAAYWPAFLALTLSILFFLRMSRNLMPTIETIAVSKTVNYISLAISEEVERALSSNEMSYNDFVEITTDADGSIRALSFRTAENGAFKRQVITALIERLENTEREVLSVPVGTLTGILIFSALGPDVRVSVQSVGDVSAQFDSAFSTAGVNQTEHVVYLDVTASVYLLLPGEIIPVSATERVRVAETVIVGQVPSTYLNLPGAN